MVNNWQKTKMKKMLLLMLAMMIANISFAQQQLATLNHDGNISVFYGSTAFRDALYASVNGDIITLSPGRFDALYEDEDGFHNKAVTIRGAGMFSDTLGNYSTDIEYMCIHDDSDTIRNLVFEGINFGRIYCGDLNNVKFIKCRINSIYSYDYQYRTEGMQFINCIIERFYLSKHFNTQFINSVILSFDDRNGDASFVNCIAKLYASEEALSSKYIMNSIIYYNDNDGEEKERNATTSYYSIGILDLSGEGYGLSANYYDTDYTPDHNLHNYHTLNSVFKTFNGEYSASETYELKDEIASSILGDDGTQVGIYGGPAPFDTNVRNPRIKRCTVASRATTDNKLAVDIEVATE